MLKLLIVFFSFCSLQTFAQYGTREPKLSRSIDPEMLWFQVDSLNAVDTTKSNADLAAFYKLRYDCDLNLYRFDKQKYHLENCLKWSSGQYFHEKTAIKPLIHGLEMAQKLDLPSKGDYFYKLILSKSTENDWTEDEKLKINNATSSLKLIGYDNYQGPLMNDHPIEIVCCEMDTLVKIHANTELNKNVETYRRYELVKGEKNNLEISVNTGRCKCTDANFSSKLLIQLTDAKLPESVLLDTSNSYWSTLTAWRIDPINEVYYGKLFQNEHGLYVVLVYDWDDKNVFGYLEFVWIAPEYLKIL